LERDKNLELKKRRLLDSLVRRGYLADKRLYKAFLEINLEDFIPKEYLQFNRLYEDIPNLFYFKNEENFRTISAPHMISIMIQGLALETNDDLLILGAKSGYIACLAHKLAPKGEIIILEANSDIAKITLDNIIKMGYEDSISVIVKNPLEGMPELSPWQKILVTGAITQDRILPLLRQLDPNEGVLYAPIGEDYIQIYTQILRINNEYYGKKQLQVRFTPLMTQVELDELQLITDLDEDEIEIKDDPKKVEDTLSKITIKYTSNILDEIKFEPLIKENVQEEDRKMVILLLKNIQNKLKKFKKENDLEKGFDYIDDMEELIENLIKYKNLFNLRVKKIQNFLNQIISLHIVRRDLEKKGISDKSLIDRKIELLNNQISICNELYDFLNDEIKRAQSI